MARISITWLGHASFLFMGEGGDRIYFDPWISGNPKCPITLDEVTAADVVVCSHGHSDHLGQSVEICRKTGAILIGSPEVCNFAHRFGVENNRQSRPMNIGGTVRVHDCAYTMVQATHSTSMAGPRYAAERIAEPDGAVCGFFLQWDNGIVVYDAADTGVFGDMALFSQMYGPQIAILPVGGKYTMGVREAARAASLIRPEVVIPCHYDTFPDQAADIGELARQVADLSPQTRVAALEYGVPWVFERPETGDRGREDAETG